MIPTVYLTLPDPAGNFSEYYSDLDEIVDDQLWRPAEVDGPRGLFGWGPPPPTVVPFTLTTWPS